MFFFFSISNIRKFNSSSLLKCKIPTYLLLMDIFLKKASSNSNPSIPLQTILSFNLKYLKKGSSKRNELLILLLEEVGKSIIIITKNNLIFPPKKFTKCGKATPKFYSIGIVNCFSNICIINICCIPFNSMSNTIDNFFIGSI